MPKIKVTYFDFHGGRGEIARIALSMGNIPFEDDRVKFKDWAERKPKTPFGGVPVLEVDGKVLSQSGAINRYVGRLTGLYPEDLWQAAKCDEVIDAVESLYAYELAGHGMKGDELARERARLVEGPLPFYLKALAKLLEQAGGEWFADNRLTIADLKVAELVRRLGNGKLDHIPTDICAREAPILVALRERVLAHPGVRAYYESKNA